MRLVSLVNDVVVELNNSQQWDPAEIIAALGWSAAQLQKVTGAEDTDISAALVRIREYAERKDLPN